MKVPGACWVVLVGAFVAGCGGQTTGSATHVDVGRDASAGGSRSGSGGAETSSGGSSSALVACNDGTGKTDCCPPGAKDGMACDVTVGACSRGCHGGLTSNLYCSPDGTWHSGLGPFPCGADAGTAAGYDAGPCRRTNPPPCSQNASPPCAPDWATAKAWYPSCSSAPFEPYLMRCGAYDAIFRLDVDVTEYFFYGAAGQLVGHETFSKPPRSCDSYDPSFVPPDVARCIPLTGSCPADAGAASSTTIPCGTQTCSTNQLCVQEMCGGGPNPCVPLPDAGTCPSGWTFDPTCPRSAVGGCDPPPCTDPPPFCADIPSSCLPLPTVPMTVCSCADSVCNFGACVEINGRNVTCAAQ